MAPLPYLLRQLTQMPRVAVTVGSEPASLAFHAYATSRHRRFPLIQNKSWGAALLEVPDTFAAYQSGASKELLRRKRRYALKAGYSFSSIRPLDHIEEILAVNSSCPARQGRRIDSAYLDEDEVKRYFSNARPVYAVLDTAGKVTAYAHTPAYGDVCVLNRLLGHSDHFDNGVMYLLVSEVIRVMCERKAALGSPRWVMYDMMFGGAEGLRYFKERLGFQPHRVYWRRPELEPLGAVRVSREAR